MTQTANLNGLEKRVSFPDSISSVYTPKNCEGIVQYIAQAKNLWFDDLDIRGTPVLMRFDTPIVQSSQTKGKLSRVWDVLRNKDQHPVLTWKMVPTYYHASRESAADYFQHWGDNCGTKNKGYRNSLKTVALNHGLVLSDELLNDAFAKIDEQIQQIYEQANNIRK